MLVLEQNNIEGITLATVKTAPPLTITGMIISGYSVQDWVCVLTGIWVLLQIYLALHNHFIKNSSTRSKGKK